MEFKRAVKTRQKLRLAIDGVSGSGKTRTALEIASGMGGRIALIDTEHGSASLYADLINFDTLDLESFQIEDYVNAINTAANAGYGILIIDSTSHAWDALNERVDRIADQRYKGSGFRAWGEGTALQRKFVEAMLTYPGHVIVTCRSKIEYSADKTEKGTTFKKVGTAAVQRQGFEYEFTMAMTMDINHVGFVTKDRTGKFQDRFIEKPGKKMGEELIQWLSTGAQDYSGEIRTKKGELWNICKSVDAAGRPLLTEEEKARVIEEMNALGEVSFEEQLKGIEAAIKRQQGELAKRLSPVAPAPQAVPVSAPPPPAAPAAPVPPSAPVEAQRPPAASPASPAKFGKPIPSSITKKANEAHADTSWMLKEIYRILDDGSVQDYMDPTENESIREEVSKSVTMSPEERWDFVAKRLARCYKVMEEAKEMEEAANKAFDKEEEESAYEDIGGRNEPTTLLEGVKERIKRKEAEKAVRQERPQGVADGSKLDIY